MFLRVRAIFARSSSSNWWSNSGTDPKMMCSLFLKTLRQNQRNRRSPKSHPKSNVIMRYNELRGPALLVFESKLTTWISQEVWSMSWFSERRIQNCRFSPLPLAILAGLPKVKKLNFRYRHKTDIKNQFIDNHPISHFLNRKRYLSGRNLCHQT